MLSHSNIHTKKTTLDKGTSPHNAYTQRDSYRTWSLPPPPLAHGHKSLVCLPCVPSVLCSVKDYSFCGLPRHDIYAGDERKKYRAEFHFQGIPSSTGKECTFPISTTLYLSAFLFNSNLSSLFCSYHDSLRV